MKTYLTSVLLGSGLWAAAQAPNTNLTTRIEDTDNTMSIEVNGNARGKDISYSRQFRVAGMRHSQKEALKKRFPDSLGVGEAPKPPVPPTPAVLPAPPKPPVPPSPDPAKGQSAVRLLCESCAGKGRLMISGHGFALERDVRNEGDKRSFPMELDLEPGEYRLMYWQNKVLQIQSSFTVKAGEKNEVRVK